MLSSEQPMKTPYRLRLVEMEEIEKAVVGVARGFVWDSTPQGHEYWATVYRNLLDLEAQARMIEADEQPCLPAL
jgi:hypothetical protein